MLKKQKEFVEYLLERKEYIVGPVSWETFLYLEEQIEELICLLAKKKKPYRRLEQQLNKWLKISKSTWDSMTEKEKFKFVKEFINKAQEEIAKIEKC